MSKQGIRNKIKLPLSKQLSIVVACILTTFIITSVITILATAEMSRETKILKKQVSILSDITNSAMNYMALNFEDEVFKDLTDADYLDNKYSITRKELVDVVQGASIHLDNADQLKLKIIDDIESINKLLSTSNSNIQETTVESYLSYLNKVNAGRSKLASDMTSLLTNITIESNILVTKVDERLTRINNVVFVMVVLSLLISLLATTIFSKILKCKINNLSEYIKSIGELDLQKEYDYKGVRDEIHTIFDNLNNLKSKLRKVVAEIQHEIHLVNEVILSVNNMTTKILTGSEDVSISTHAISDETSNTAKEVNDISALIEELTASSQEVFSTITDLSQRNSLCVSNIKSSVIDMQNLNNNMISINNHVKELLSKSAKLSESSKAIKSFTTVLKNISSETKLLSLNASIEAARIGSEGNGFNVVAKSMQKLSYSSEESTKEIEAITEHILNEIAEIENYIKSVSGLATTGELNTNNSVSVFTGLVEVLDKVNQDVTLTSNSMGEVTANIDSMSRNIINVSKTSNMIAEVTKQVSDVVEEQDISIKSTSEHIDKLNETIDHLSDIVNRFNV